LANPLEQLQSLGKVTVGEEQVRLEIPSLGTAEVAQLCDDVTWFRDVEPEGEVEQAAFAGCLA
jgi:hypothetical protein